MRLELDTARCEGFGFCAEAAPELIRIDDDGQVVLLHPVLGPIELEQARAAARACPVAALRLAEIER